MLVAKVDNVKHKGVDLTIKPRGLGKLYSGLIIQVNSNKVPRIIGREGSMVNLIKQETGCEIVVGQNGIIWIKGSKIEDELFAKEVINFVTEKSYLAGLTEKVQEFIKEKKKVMMGKPPIIPGQVPGQTNGQQQPFQPLQV